MAQVAVSVAVAGGGRSNVDTETEGLPGVGPAVQRAVNGAVAQGGVMRPRNDIADFLGADSTFGKLLKRVADFFENLDPDGTKPWSDEEKLKIAFGLALAEQANQPSAQAIGDWFGGECVQNLLTGVRDDVNEALIGLANKVPQRLQEFLGCTLQHPQAQLAIPGLPQLDLANIDIGQAIGCLIKAAGVYQTNKNVWSALWSFGTCMLAGGGGGGGGGAQVEHESVSRC